MQKTPESLCATDIPLFVDPDFDLNTVQLRNWHTPSSVDHDHLQASIEATREQVIVYDEQLKKLQECVRTLEVQKGLAVKSEERKRSLLSPIRRLPVEILGEIFGICYRSLVEMGYYIPFLKISHTCAHWRQVAPRMWPVISIRLDKLSIGQSKLLSKHLSALEGMPLTITAKFFTPIVKRAYNSFSLLLDRSSRWKSLTLSSSSEHFRKFGEREESLCFSQLQNLDLCILSSGNVDEEGQKISYRMFKSAVNLRRFQLIGDDPRHFALPFSTLTSLDIPLDRLEYLAILDMCSNLQELQLSLGLDPEPSIDLPMLPIYSSNISRLMINHFGAPRDSDLFYLLHLPRLEFLYIRPWFASGYSGFLRLTPVLSFLSRSKPPLHTLALEASADRSVLLDVLYTVPSIIHLAVPKLDLEDGPGNDLEEFFLQLILSPKTTPCVPVLSSLELFIDGKQGDLNSKLHVICDVVESRLVGFETAYLKSVTVKVYGGWYRDAVEGIHRFQSLARRLGVNLSLEWLSESSLVQEYGRGWERNKLQIYLNEEDERIWDGFSALAPLWELF